MTSRRSALTLALAFGSALACLTASASDATDGALLLGTEPSQNDASLLDRLLGVASALGHDSQRPVRGPAAERGFSGLGLSPSQPGLAILCDRGGAGAIGLSEQCMLARLELDATTLPGYGNGVGLSGAWFIERAGIDVNYGLAWLSVQQPQRFGAAPSLWPGLPGLSEATPLHLALPTSGHAQRLSFGLGFELGEGGWLRIEGQNLRSQGRTVDLWGIPVPVFESDALSFSAGSGALSSTLSARSLELRGLPGVLNSLDLGITWRTPWRGELTVGATQYWSRGDTRNWPLRELPPVEETAGRVPYVRYQQDL
ncbi:hypothetical protein [Aquimonas voraii]|uniref:Uncharacterized protein n=1 Tax=Aquimonas voraii TaxID=265719 RepID=A0A1G7A2N2_9GAMM|nr:hypothetical protein [Aquimonas voraii]SDE09218.1 hypothetical protein SAMN04488509_11827 [Aquimonas voraii]